jgi:hypothetical protein
MDAEKLTFGQAIKPALLFHTAPISMWEALNVSDEIYQQIGEHGAKIGTLEYEMREMRRELTEIRRVLAEARGGWKTLMLVGGAAGAAGALMAKIAGFVGFFK